MNVKFFNKTFDDDSKYFRLLALSSYVDLWKMSGLVWRRCLLGLGFRTRVCPKKLKENKAHLNMNIDLSSSLLCDPHWREPGAGHTWCEERGQGRGWLGFISGYVCSSWCGNKKGKLLTLCDLTRGWIYHVNLANNINSINSSKLCRYLFSNCESKIKVIFIKYQNDWCLKAVRWILVWNMIPSWD